MEKESLTTRTLKALGVWVTDAQGYQRVNKKNPITWIFVIGAAFINAGVACYQEFVGTFKDAFND